MWRNSFVMLSSDFVHPHTCDRHDAFRVVFNLAGMAPLLSATSCPLAFVPRVQVVRRCLEAEVLANILQTSLILDLLFLRQVGRLQSGSSFPKLSTVEGTAGGNEHVTNHSRSERTRVCSDSQPGHFRLDLLRRQGRFLWPPALCASAGARSRTALTGR